MTRSATVIRIIDPSTVQLVMGRSSACGKACEGCAGCLTTDKVVFIEALNSVGARTGDRVELDIPASGMSGIAFIVYIVPFLFFMAGYFAAKQMRASDSYALIAGCTGFILGILIAFSRNRSLKKKGLKVNVKRIYNVRGGMR